MLPGQKELCVQQKGFLMYVQWFAFDELTKYEAHSIQNALDSGYYYSGGVYRGIFNEFREKYGKKYSEHKQAKL